MTYRQHVDRLRQTSPNVLPSLLLCDFGNLEKEVQLLEAARVRALHLDVMDGEFVPNLTYGFPIVEALGRLTSLPLDVHLMIKEPRRYLEQFHEAGANFLTVHIESESDSPGTLRRIRDLDMGAGIALNPSTPLERIDDCLDVADIVVIMSVEAGFGGQAFNDVALERIREIRRRVGANVLIEVDGGIQNSTIGPCARAGADLFVVGSAIFNSSDYRSVVNELTELASITADK